MVAYKMMMICAFTIILIMMTTLLMKKLPLSKEKKLTIRMWIRANTSQPTILPLE